MNTRYILTTLIDDEYFYVVLDSNDRLVYEGFDRNAAKAALMGI